MLPSRSVASSTPDEPRRDTLPRPSAGARPLVFRVRVLPAAGPGKYPNSVCSASGDGPEPGPGDDDAGEDPSDQDAGDADGEVTKGSAIENSDLPPIHEIPAIFSDLVSRIPQVKDVAEHLKGRKMRVATMCSGTESPLLALNLITHYISEHFGVSLDWEHVFSCEIEPFKQAYIERNFSPPILFRDICELGDDEA